MMTNQEYCDSLDREIAKLIDTSIAEGRRQERERTKSILENFGALDDKNYSPEVHVVKAIYADIVSENIESELSQLAINITHQPKRKS